MSKSFRDSLLDRAKIHEIIFEADTPMGKTFDVLLLILILASVLVVMLESVSELNARYHDLFVILEWCFTLLFTIEYLLRLYCVYKPWKYATSFFGIIDLLAILPTYLAIVFAGSQSLVTIRALRLLRVFRIFKLASFLNQGNLIVNALKASRAKIAVFLFFIMIMVTITGSVMYLVEGNANSGFTSIPRSIYWAIVTLTTVGYGDIAPATSFGQLLAAIVMVMGYSVIAVPTGIVSAEMLHQSKKKEEILSTQSCRHCTSEGHDADAVYCKYCGELIHDLPEESKEDQKEIASG